MAPAFSCTVPSCKLPFSSSSSSKLSKKTTTQSQCPPFLKQQQPANWASLSSDINTHVLKSLPKTPPPAVAEPMHRLVAAAPPSVAPALCLAACELVGGRKDQAMKAACAIQLMHSAIHTRSQLLGCSGGSVPSTIAPGIQLMTGDGIMPFGYEMIAGGVSTNNPERVLRVIVEITKAMGPLGVVEGQLLEAEGSGEAVWAWERKAGTLSSCGAASGAILGGGSEEDVEKLRRFGWYVGMVNEMFSSGNAARYREVAEAFRSLARLELQGFDKEKVDSVLGLFLGSEFMEISSRGLA